MIKSVLFLFHRWFMILTVVSLSLLSFLLSSCQKNQIAAPEAQEPCGYVQNVYGERISWKDQLPIPLYINNSVPEEYVPIVEKATQAWEKAAGKKLFQIMGRRPSSTPVKDGYSEIFYLQTWDQDKTTEQGRTSVYWVGDLIYEADIRINQKDFQFFTAESGASSSQEVDIESLLIHELGHVLGLKHKDSDGSVMATFLPGSVSRNQIATTDVEALKCEYK
ncbi:MAG: matrixin family metalloprotease [Pseudobdellovibrionaceae bacterium]